MTTLCTLVRRQALSTCIVPTLSSSCANAIECVGESRNARWTTTSTASADKISVIRSSARLSVKLTLYTRDLAPAVVGASVSRHTTLRTFGSSSNNPTRLVPRNCAAPVIATTRRRAGGVLNRPRSASVSECEDVSELLTRHSFGTSDYGSSDDWQSSRNAPDS